MNLHAPRIRTELQVMFFDTDCGGVVHNIAYLRFIEIARTLLAEQLGMALADMAQSQRYPVVVRTELIIGELRGWATAWSLKVGSIDSNESGSGADFILPARR